VIVSKISKMLSVRTSLLRSRSLPATVIAEVVRANGQSGLRRDDLSDDEPDGKEIDENVGADGFENEDEERRQSSRCDGWSGNS
jgi:hypothetical protein